VSRGVVHMALPDRYAMSRAAGTAAATVFGLAALAGLDLLLTEAEAPDPTAWLAAAIAPVSIGWLIAGAALGRGARWSALLSTGAYAAWGFGVAAVAQDRAARPELVALVPVALFSAHAGAVFMVARRRAMAHAVVAQILGSAEGTARTPAPDELAALGLDESVLADAGVLGGLLRVHWAREAKAWAVILSVAAGGAAFGLAGGLPTVAAAGGAATAAGALAFAARSLLGFGKGGAPFERLVAGDFTRAQTDFLKLLALVPADSIARLGLAMACLLLREPERAATEFVTARLSGVGEIPLGLVLGTERQLGVALREAGSETQLEHSLRSFRRVLGVFPTSMETWYDLGLTLEAAGGRRAALLAYRRAAERGLRPAVAAVDRLTEAGGGADREE